MVESTAKQALMSPMCVVSCNMWLGHEECRQSPRGQLRANVGMIQINENIHHNHPEVYYDFHSFFPQTCKNVLLHGAECPKQGCTYLRMV